MRIFYNTGFTQIPNYILRSKVSKPSQKVVLAVLCSYANDENVAFPSYQTIANDSGISRRKAIVIVADLEKLGCIRKVIQKSNGEGTAQSFRHSSLKDFQLDLHLTTITSMTFSREFQLEDTPKSLKRCLTVLK